MADGYTGRVFPRRARRKHTEVPGELAAVASGRAASQRGGRSSYVLLKPASSVSMILVFLRKRRIWLRIWSKSPQCEKRRPKRGSGKMT